MIEPQQTPAILWNGYARRGGSRGKWQRLVTGAESEATALDELRRLTSSWQFVDLCVRPADRGDPNDKGPRPAA